MHTERPATSRTTPPGKRDGELLRRYVEERSEAAFSELGRRYAGLIYAVCLREIGDRTLAEDAAQGVFLLLSRKAPGLQNSDSLAGWLYTASRYVARNLVRQERKRTMKEQQAAREFVPDESEDNPLWERVEPHFYDALGRLKAADREAILLRFVQGQSLGEVGAFLGLSENTARMRINRGLEKIRTHLQKAGIALTLGALTALLVERPAQAVPARVFQSLSKIAAGQMLPTSSAPAISKAVRQASARTATAPARLAWVGLLGMLLISMGAYHQLMPQRLNGAEQRRWFVSLSGKWNGTLEFADDLSRQHYVYPAQIDFQLQNNNDTLRGTTTYQGSSRVDVTEIRRDPRADTVQIQNGGEKSSHALDVIGSLFQIRDGSVLFEGHDVAGRTETRLRFQQQAGQLTIHEEFRKPGQTNFQFRNHYTLQRAQ